jgi:hypothetical protein
VHARYEKFLIRVHPHDGGSRPGQRELSG